MHDGAEWAAGTPTKSGANSSNPAQDSAAVMQQEQQDTEQQLQHTEQHTNPDEATPASSIQHSPVSEQHTQSAAMLEALRGQWSGISRGIKENATAGAEVLVKHAASVSQLEDFVSHVLMQLQALEWERGELRRQLQQDRAEFAAQAKLLSGHFHVSQHRSTALQVAHEALQVELHRSKEEAAAQRRQGHALSQQLVDLQAQVQHSQAQHSQGAAEQQALAAEKEALQHQLEHQLALVHELKHTRVQLQAQVRGMAAAEQQLTEHLSVTHAQIDEQLQQLREQLKGERQKRVAAQKKKTELQQQVERMTQQLEMLTQEDGDASPPKPGPRLHTATRAATKRGFIKLAKGPHTHGSGSPAGGSRAAATPRSMRPAPQSSVASTPSPPPGPVQPQPQPHVPYAGSGAAASMRQPHASSTAAASRQAQLPLRRSIAGSPHITPSPTSLSAHITPSPASLSAHITPSPASLSAHITPSPASLSAHTPGAGAAGPSPAAHLLPLPSPAAAAAPTHAATPPPLAMHSHVVPLHAPAIPPSPDHVLQGHGAARTAAEPSKAAPELASHSGTPAQPPQHTAPPTSMPVPPNYLHQPTLLDYRQCGSRDTPEGHAFAPAPARSLPQLGDSVGGGGDLLEATFSLPRHPPPPASLPADTSQPPPLTPDLAPPMSAAAAAAAAPLAAHASAPAWHPAQPGTTQHELVGPWLAQQQQQQHGSSRGPAAQAHASPATSISPQPHSSRSLANKLSPPVSIIAPSSSSGGSAPSPLRLDSGPAYYASPSQAAARTLLPPSAPPAYAYHLHQGHTDSSTPSSIPASALPVTAGPLVLGPSSPAQKAHPSPSTACGPSSGGGGGPSAPFYTPAQGEQAPSGPHGAAAQHQGLQQQQWWPPPLQQQQQQQQQGAVVEGLGEVAAERGRQPAQDPHEVAGVEVPRHSHPGSGKGSSRRAGSPGAGHRGSGGGNRARSPGAGHRGSGGGNRAGSPGGVHHAAPGGAAGVRSMGGAGAAVGGSPGGRGCLETHSGCRGARVAWAVA